MAVPNSGELKLWKSIWNDEIGGSKGENSLHSASVYAGFSTPDALSDFYGWSDVEPASAGTCAASSVQFNSMTANGRVISDGGGNVSARGFRFGTNNNATSNPAYAVGSGTGNFNRSFTSLSSSTTYRMWAYATNEAGTALGGQVSQATQAPVNYSGTPFTYSGNGAQNTYGYQFGNCSGNYQMGFYHAFYGFTTTANCSNIAGANFSGNTCYATANQSRQRGGLYESLGTGLPGYYYITVADVCVRSGAGDWTNPSSFGVSTQVPISPAMVQSNTSVMRGCACAFSPNPVSSVGASLYFYAT